MDLERKAKLARAGMGLIFALSVGSFPSGPAAQARPPSHRSSLAQSLFEQRVVAGDCQVVDAQGLPLYDSQFEQRTGHKPCE